MLCFRDSSKPHRARHERFTFLSETIWIEVKAAASPASISPKALTVKGEMFAVLRDSLNASQEQLFMKSVYRPLADT